MAPSPTPSDRSNSRVLGMEDVEVVDWRARGNQYGDGVVGIAAKKTNVVVVEEGMRALEPTEPR